MGGRRFRVAVVIAASGLVPLAALMVPAGCGGRPPSSGDTGPTPLATAPPDARAALAGRAAAAKDRRFSASYRLMQPGRQSGSELRTVAVMLATDGGWRVDVGGGALGGTIDVAVIGLRDGLYECVLGTAGSCVKVSPPGGTLPIAADPRVEHVFTDWLEVFIDRRAAVSVARAQPLPGVTGDCFSLEPSAVSLVGPLDPGIYCFAADGTITGARAAFGTLTLASAVGPPPPTLTLPGPVVPGAPPNTAPPPPTATPSAGPTRR